MVALRSDAQVTSRHLATDEQGSGLRATWRPNLGFVNLSLWSGQRCTSTFHLTPVEAGKLVGFLASSLASAAPERRVNPLSAVPPSGPPASTLATARPGEAVRRRVADELERLAHRLRP
ncbi:MAG: hypothetical protein AVDCRST_MAG50-1208 [uncultured Acidimicrobiales bacterium]|uniref:Uncharacterized protein n=1 Tax=uncultured Acidimicrobiales bacterium TaxID=310071 RepID=A0A6J4HV81_9ACTN|nr:MAG: hypothetical protein AVDCRST_MAG50-1208 [uncultured Acidimicrobiales bacterium]